MRTVLRRPRCVTTPGSRLGVKRPKALNRAQKRLLASCIAIRLVNVRGLGQLRKAFCCGTKPNGEHRGSEERGQTNSGFSVPKGQAAYVAPYGPDTGPQAFRYPFWYSCSSPARQRGGQAPCMKDLPQCTKGHPQTLVESVSNTCVVTVPGGIV